jgi:nucleoside-diphosphate-sugar epimerase
MDRVHVVFGPTGGIGSAIVRRLVEQGELVRAIARDPEEAKEILPAAAGIVGGSADSADIVQKACQGATIVYDCINVRYSKWAEQLPQLTANIVAGARAAGARLVFPDNVLCYGHLQKTPVTEEHPRAATSKKGKIRTEIERMLLEAHRRGEVPVVIPRYPDFYGPFVTNPLVRPMFESAVEGKTATWPVNLDVPHDMVFIEDAAAAAVRLAMDDDAYGQVWHVPGRGPVTGRQFLGGAFKAAGKKPKMRSVGPGMYRFFGLFIPDAGEMSELLYQYAQPLVLDGGKFAQRFSNFQYTTHDEGLRRTVEWFQELVG